MPIKTKADKRKDKLKALRRQEDAKHTFQADRLSAALEELCAPALPEYIDDTKCIDMVGRKIIYQLGQIAWNIALSGRTAVSDSEIALGSLDENERQILKNEVTGLILRKNTLFPNIGTSIDSIKVITSNGKARVKVKSGHEVAATKPTENPPPLVPLTPEQILELRKSLSLSQVKFSEQVGVSVKTVSAWEHGKSHPDDAQESIIRELIKNGDSS